MSTKAKAVEDAQPIVEELERRIQHIKRPIFEIFDEKISAYKLSEVSHIISNTTNYIVAITPRSGSSYLCDLLERTGKLGRPNEYLNPSLLPNIRKRIPGRNIIDYWIELVNKRTVEGVFGIKASYFQFVPMIESGLDNILFDGYKIVCLFRKNILLQAVSLYLATETNIYHTNIQHSDERWGKLKDASYNELKIRQWLEHIYAQERGWKDYSARSDVIEIYYEDICNGPQVCIDKVANFLGVEGAMPLDFSSSTFKKVSTDKNHLFANEFLSVKDNHRYLKRLGLREDRYH